MEPHPCSPPVRSVTYQWLSGCWDVAHVTWGRCECSKQRRKHTIDHGHPEQPPFRCPCSPPSRCQPTPQTLGRTNSTGGRPVLQQHRRHRHLVCRPTSTKTTTSPCSSVSYHRPSSTNTSVWRPSPAHPRCDTICPKSARSHTSSVRFPLYDIVVNGAWHKQVLAFPPA